MRKFYILILLNFVLFSANTQAEEIIINFFEYDQEVRIGQPATIRWNFENADEVQLSESSFIFKAVDSLTVYPQTSSNYTFIAVNLEGNITQKASIKVIGIDEDFSKPSTIDASEDKHQNDKFNHLSEDESTRTLQVKPIKPKVETVAEVGFTTSNYFVNSTIDYQEATLPISFRIVSVKPHRILPNTLSLRVLPIDKFGNFVTGLQEYGGFCSFSYAMQCETTEHNGVIKDYSEFSNKSGETFVSSIIIENSIFTNENEKIINAIENYVSSTDDNIGLQLHSFSHKLISSSPIGFGKIKEDIINDYKEKIFPENGLSSIYRCVSEILDNDLSATSNIQYTLIISGTDNASLIYDINDLVSIANSKDISINVIGIGDKIRPFSLEYLAIQTGGYFYHIESQQTNQIAEILKEIENSQNKYYSMDINYDEHIPYLCDKSIISIDFNHKENHNSANFEYNFVSMPHYAIYQSVALFEQDSLTFSDDYTSNIELIADILKQNDDIAIQLIGNTSMATEDDNALNISLERVISIYKLLNEKGVETEKIRFKGIGKSKPIYFLENTKWKQQLNNRVDIKWLAPALYPYEIITQTVSSEEAALDKVLEWETLGYNSYFERKLERGIPVYSVKLWGFKTEVEANQAIQVLKRDFDFDFFIE